MVDYPDVFSLSRDEVVEEYCKLFDQYKDLRESHESDTQKIHDLKRTLDTATAAQLYLSQELEQYATFDNTKTEKELHKTQMELLDMKKKFSDLEASHINMQQDNNTLLKENLLITKNLEECQKKNQQITAEDDKTKLDDSLMRIELLENENLDLLQKIDDFEKSSVTYTLTLAEYEKNIEILSDQITCLEENLQSKRFDLEEKIQIIESTQEQLAEVNAKLAVLSSAPNNNDRKGNSLFAEVDDQRQAMKQLLAAQKKSYMQMKKIYNESENEIRRLKRENISMRTEFEACSAIFCNADRIYQKKLNDRVSNLLNQNEEVERKLKWTQENLCKLAADKGVLFIDSILSFCKKETEEFKSQLHRVLLLNASLEEQLRDSQQEMARWRFESLKSRCILIDRENLLTENNILFKPIHAVEYQISEKDQNEARPRIVSNRRSSILENLTNRKSITPTKLSIKTETTSAQENVIENTESLNVNNIKTELINESVDQDSTPCQSEQISPHELPTSENNKAIKVEIDTPKVESLKLSGSFNLPINQQQCKDEDKENSIICLDDSIITDNFANLRVQSSPMHPSQNIKTTTSPIRSILNKNDLLTNTSKHVKFSSDGDTVYNMSLDHSLDENNANNTKTEFEAETKHAISSSNTEKKPRTKSNIVVRRFVVSSKQT